MKTVPFIILAILLFSQCDSSKKETMVYKYEQSESRELDEASKKAILQKLDAYNTDSVCIYETPTYERLSNDPNIHTHIKNRMDILKLFEQKNDKLDSTTVTKTDSIITVHEFFYIHGQYAFVPSYIINDTSIQITTREVIIVDPQYYIEKKELITTDVTIVHPAEIITELKINKKDRNKTVYYKNKMLTPHFSH